MIVYRVVVENAPGFLDQPNQKHKHAYGSRRDAVKKANELVKRHEGTSASVWLELLELAPASPKERICRLLEGEGFEVVDRTRYPRPRGRHSQ